jgi:hypothetical protein
MYKHARESRDAISYRVINLDTEEEIKHCIWADDASGIYCAYETDKSNDYLFATDCLGRKLTGNNQQLKTKVKKGNIKFIRSDC